jgi:hypothetical protein
MHCAHDGCMLTRIFRGQTRRSPTLAGIDPLT